MHQYFSHAPVRLSIKKIWCSDKQSSISKQEEGGSDKGVLVPREGLSKPDWSMSTGSL